MSDNHCVVKGIELGEHTSPSYALASPISILYRAPLWWGWRFEMTFSEPQQKLEHRSNPAYQGAHGHAPEAEEALGWVLLETVSFPSSF